MKNKDKILHICLLCAFAFQLIFMFMDIGTYGFLSNSVITFADLLILARLLIFVPLCIYEAFKIYKCVIEEKKNNKKRHHRHHHRHRHSHHHSHSSSSGMSAEYKQKTYFMDTEKLLEKQREEKKKKYAQENKEN